MVFEERRRNAHDAGGAKPGRAGLLHHRDLDLVDQLGAHARRVRVRDVRRVDVGGAEGDGAYERIEPGPIAKNTKADKTPKVAISLATGREQVSSTRDIAPTFVSTCGGCHGRNNPRGGFSLVSFELSMDLPPSWFVFFRHLVLRQ